MSDKVQNTVRNSSDMADKLENLPVHSDVAKTTVIKLKRKLGTESSDTIIVSSKRKCLEASSSQATITTVLKKLTTVEKDEYLQEEINKALEVQNKLSKELKENYKQGFHPISREKKRINAKYSQSLARFKLTSCKRNLIENTDDKQTKTNLDIHIFDATREDETTPLQVALAKDDVITCNGEAMESTKYVYDLYFTSVPVDHSSWIENICEIQNPDKLELVWEDEQNSQSDESDDENAEDNWRNDYPDEDEDPFIYEDEEDYLSKQFVKTKLYDEDESYDEEEYDESGDFDDDGNLIPSYGNAFREFKNYFRKEIRHRNESESSSCEDLN